MPMPMLTMTFRIITSMIFYINLIARFPNGF